MSESKLHGVIAAIATAVDATGEPDCARSTALARYLLASGCDGLNVLGTTGEATSFAATQRMKVMTAYRAAALPLERMMVGTGAAALDDAIALTRHAAALGFAGALVLPPFYYKGVPDDGLCACIEAIVAASAENRIPIYLYHFPAQSGLPWHLALIRRLTAAFGQRIVGLKDSSRVASVRRAIVSSISNSSRLKYAPATSLTSVVTTVFRFSSVASKSACEACVALRKRPQISASNVRRLSARLPKVRRWPNP